MKFSICKALLLSFFEQYMFTKQTSEHYYLSPATFPFPRDQQIFGLFGSIFGCLLKLNNFAKFERASKIVHDTFFGAV
jgi:hypothetical protein